MVNCIKLNYQIYKKLLIFVLIVCIFGVFYFSWISTPNFEQETYLPLWIREWSNQNYNLRTAVPFVVIGFLLGFRPFENILQKNLGGYLKELWVHISISAAIVCLAEGGQFFIKSRNPDIMDVFYGIMGSVLGGLAAYILCFLIYFLRLQKLS